MTTSSGAGYFTHLVPDGTGDLTALCGHILGKSDNAVGTYHVEGVPVDCQKCTSIHTGDRGPVADDVGADDAALRAAVVKALVDDAWEDHDEPLTVADLERIAEVATRALAAVPRSVTQPEGLGEGDEVWHCGGCGYDYDPFEESHVGHAPSQPAHGEPLTDWAETLRNDGTYEYTITGDCRGTWEQALRRRPATSTKPGVWEQVDAIPNVARYPYEISAEGGEQS